MIRFKYKIITASAIAFLPVVMEASILQIGLPQLSSALALDYSLSHWLLTAVAMACAMTIPVSAFVSHILGTKKVWLLSQAIFLVGTLLCGFCDQFLTLLGCRILQGVALGLMSPLLASVIVEQLGVSEFRAALGTTSILVASGHALGIMLGGVVIEYCHWHWLFWMSIPINAIGFYLTIAWFKQTPATDIGKTFDGIGLLLIALPMGLLATLMQPDMSHYQTVLMAAIMTAIIFVWYAFKKESDPILDIKIFMRQNYASTLLSLSLVYFLTFAFSSFIPFYFAQAKNMSAQEISNIFIFFALGNIMARIVQEKIFAKSNANTITWITAAVGCAVFLSLLTVLDKDDGIVWYLTCFVHGFLCGLLIILLTGQVPKILPKAELKDGLTLTRVHTQIATILGFFVPALVIKNVSDVGHEYAQSMVVVLCGAWFLVLCISLFSRPLLYESKA